MDGKRVEGGSVLGDTESPLSNAPGFFFFFFLFHFCDLNFQQLGALVGDGVVGFTSAISCLRPSGRGGALGSKLLLALKSHTNMGLQKLDLIKNIA